MDNCISSPVSLNEILRRSLKENGLLMISMVECASDDFEETYLFDARQVTPNKAKDDFKHYQTNFSELVVQDDDLSFERWMISKGIQCEKVNKMLVKPSENSPKQYILTN